MRKIVLELTKIKLKDGNDNPCKGCLFDDMNLQYRDDVDITCMDKFPCTHISNSETSSTVWKVIKP
jgi:hypothetical protein